jgi:anti-anti-sigma factor
MVVRIAVENSEQGDRSARPPEGRTRELVGLADLGGTANAEHEATVDIRSPEPGVAQVVLGGEHDLSTAVQLEETLDQALATCSHLIVDLSSAEFIDSSTIKVLVNTQKVATKRDCPFNLVLSTTPIVERALEITGVLETLNRAHSLEEALRPPGAPS